MDDPYPALRDGIIQFVERLDKLQRVAPQLASQNEGTDTFFDALVEATRQICECIPIRRLLGRAREASREEIFAAAKVLMDLADNEGGAEMLEGLEGPATKDGNTEMASVMAKARHAMGESRNGTSSKT